MKRRLSVAAETQDWAWLAGLVILKYWLHTWLVIPVYELHRDEFLYLDQANHLAWGYTSVPPFTSWIALLIQWLGHSEWWVRFFPMLFGTATMIVVWYLVKALGGNLYARLLAAMGVLLSVLLRLNTLFQPNSFDVLSWTALYGTVILYLRTSRPRWLYLGAVVLALGFLNKYNILFLLVGLLTALALTPQRRLFGRSHVWSAAGLALLLVLPNIIWQVTHDFPVVTHMRELSQRQLVHVRIPNFLYAQLLFFIGSVPVILAGWYALWTYPPFRSYRVFFWTFPLTLLVFVGLKAKDYYAIGLYPVFVAFGAAYLGNRLRRGWWRAFKPVLLIFPVLCFLPIAQTGFPNRSPEYIYANRETYRAWGMLRWEDGKDHDLPQDFADMLGWKELARLVDSAYAGIPDQAKTIVVCDNYGQAGAINYYSRKGVKAVSFNADYRHWIPFDRTYTHLIRVVSGPDAANWFTKTAPYFSDGRRSGAITNRYAREYGTEVQVFIGAQFDLNRRLEAEARQEK